MRNIILEKLQKQRYLQIALDFIKIDDALNIVEKVKNIENIIIEAGTPLIKSAGIEGLRKLRELAPDKIILADTKTADAGDVEVEIAKIGKADIMTVLGIMHNSTIELTVKKARELDMVVQADLINVRNLYDRAKEIKSLGVDIIGFHIGLDVQRTLNISAIDLKNEIEKVSKLGTIISVAGGLNKEKIADLIDLPINIFVVGTAITKSSDPKRVVEEIVNILK
ncbi:D-arabino 3-hexulose 6-phosphate aldehyde lyase [Sulfolobus sp. A20]|uniref:orotidine 5'-phosphate decarboxylase / HUMPS family protein n=1 Tax=Sulfolobaceae TaxID=118883 RepID=UPI00084626C6|nr:MULTISPECIES: orotidine 5'-phosphate decarboxylase / HUMPS family protein [unclassified Sulfolobus]TRM77073.1 D-arabino 3-hexulose 6-phosphate aldehyde lyase [Sulfolobus sp. B5]TRM77789.1 D-arabino 3-hexulose 6-phosphate aldehyde lyase [Sulfolobus sp. A20-N-F8]TRM84212.1 D-arabino 3-hexulose 6-phosphate aldehyde lyase [Sulfolobus sp. F3]TRM87544.1 D-arabino 3-hexulose 6-phosphate aldehyde lyase [Sulfolobus sp. C3]TRM94744.1 D-arabino 3-hexulose 6-phosphate aldehyde lyase [Sulfolobus sp. A20